MTPHCPHCGVPLSTAYGQHVERCVKLPAAATLQEHMDAGLSCQTIGDRYGVSKSFVSIQCRRLGIVNPRTCNVVMSDRPSRELDLILELAPLRGTTVGRGCSEACSGWAECHERGKVGLWVLCSAPERDEVERARARLAGMHE